MGSISPPLRPLPKHVVDRINAFLRQAKSSQFPIDVHLEAERLVGHLPDLQLNRDQIAREILERSTKITGLGVVISPPPQDAGQGT